MEDFHKRIFNVSPPYISYIIQIKYAILTLAFPKFKVLKYIIVKIEKIKIKIKLILKIFNEDS